ncbi:cytochrome b (mitochondrion) [Apis mellifera ligustica]|uniref:Cytochrome b n=27 Tax=Apoidea TaxID=34735 RepID=CYB_APILI|nr:cytochrome b [Apis mellifera ligustica]P34845.1 RecName: Full=Cytochrome b; AltName: Full=Complex III subunit 3; AltName: Full=Complex III subunit III; AltName: Full=Cytochrome b-c1 complex subunit 3; AltName: Full=Ubiquinol-cytochrome-c reductase complex cytochrome b subunit [Apis mellifera ligustica]ARS01170.1 cytochrome b [Apis mellifera meda]QFQ51693.1 cytochrome b [Apis mellifera carnica]QJC59603.1 cytochrome b [Apis mellifera anatoliaca]WKD80483.1 cytochrome b [Apis mellifera]BBA7848|eukprot:NP_008093.1 cytochrome b (mitochondrion) [Apis mellifera ligustica]
MKKFMNFFSSNEFLKMIMSTIYLPTPVNINYMWNFGSILGIFLMIQIISGFILSMHYCPNIDIAFWSITNIMKDMNSGWLFRLIHMNGASFYFLMMYIHISRNLFYCSYKLNNVWGIGIMILLMSMAAAFMGYVLPWGQMSYWGATVITNLLSAIPYIGDTIVLWIWGGFSINNATLNRFFSLHFILPLLILFMVILHLFALHLTGSSNPLGSNFNNYKISFHPYFSIKDLLGFYIILFIFMFINFQFPYHLGDPDNFKIANPMNTPTHIKPEWYFLFAYSILRAIPNKLGGVIGLVMSILILYIMIFYNNKMMNNKFNMLNKIYYWMFINNFILLTWLGKQLIEYPFTNINMLFTTTYFLYFFLNFYLSKLWDNLIWNSPLN